VIATNRRGSSSDGILCPEVVRDTLDFSLLHPTGPPTYLILRASKPPNSPDSRVRLS
jgi:hypothetical protein